MYVSNRNPGLRTARGLSGRRRGLGMSQARANRIVSARLRGLGYSYDAGVAAAGAAAGGSVALPSSGNISVYGSAPVSTPLPSEPGYSSLPAGSSSPSSALTNSQITQLLSTGITTAGNVAKTAVTPPLYSSSVSYPGYSATTSAYGPLGSSFGSLTGSISPIWLLLGVGVFAILLLKK